MAAIWLRGYLVPFTPVLAPRLVDRLPWDPFHSATRTVHRRDDNTVERAPDGGRDVQNLADTAPGNDTGDGEVVLETLVDADVVDTSGEEIIVDPTFEERWHEEMASLSEASPDDLADETRAVSPSEAARAVTEYDRTYVVLSDGSGDPAAEVWLRQAVAVAETGAARTLTDVDVDDEIRPLAAHGLGVFLEECPVCEEALTDGPAGGCCGPPRTDADGRPLQALKCPDCLAEFAVYN